MNMVSKCGSQVVACVTDETCKAALDCLQECDPLDQVRPRAYAGSICTCI